MLAVSDEAARAFQKKAGTVSPAPAFLVPCPNIALRPAPPGFNGKKGLLLVGREPPVFQIFVDDVVLEPLAERLHHLGAEDHAAGPHLVPQ